MIVWKTLIHNGVLFPPPFKRLPTNIKLLYSGSPINLTEEQEEVACLYAKVMDTIDNTSTKNFSKDFRKLVGKSYKWELFDFTQIQKYITDNPVKITIPPETLEKYRFCMVDGHKETVANFMVEPPGLFKGRGDHPLRGCLKKRVYPNEVTINISKGVTIPKPNVPGNWYKVVHDQSAMWIAAWRQNVTGKIHYVYLGQGSRVRMDKDKDKFDVARKLGKNIHKIKKRIETDMKSSDKKLAQTATAVWFIDNLAIRIGNEKGDDEAQTVGVTNLLLNNISLVDGNTSLYLNFLGKDSIKYAKTVNIPPLVASNIETFMKNKTKNDQLFDLIDSKIVNEYLDMLSPGLTAKVFRTYNASKLFQELLEKAFATLGKQPKISDVYRLYNLANVEVAELCNHQKGTTTINSRDEIKKITERIKKATGKKKKELIEQKRLKKAKKNLNLTTSRQNYIDPRITVSFSKKIGIPIERFFSARLVEKFKWALEVNEEFVF